MNEEGFILNPDGFKFLLHPAGCWQSLACAQMPNLLPTHSPQRATCPLASESEGQRSVWARAEDLPKGPLPVSP